MRTRRGFSLIESVVAAGIVGILMLAVAGVLGLAARAMPTEDDVASRSARMSAVLSDLADDLASASAVVSVSATAISLRVPDRDGDDVPDTLAYQLSGGSLTRRLNARTAGIALTGVESLSFTPAWVSVDRRSATGITTSAAQQLAAFSPTTSNTFRISSSNHIAQVVIPRLDEDVVSWTPTSVRVRMVVKGGLLTNTTCRIFDGDVTSGTMGSLLGTSTGVSLLSGSMAGWASFDFSGVGQIARQRPVTIVLSSLALLSTSDVSCETSGVFDGFLAMAQSSNAGSSWTAFREGAMGFEVVGTLRRPGTSTATTSRLDALAVDLSIKDLGRVRRLIPVAGRPAME